MQHAIGDHALLADSRTAALLDPEGGVAWCCWPRVDSDPVFFRLLDEMTGGAFVVRPATAAAHVESRAYMPGSLALRTVWRCGTARLVVDDALQLGGEPALLREVRAEGGPVPVEVEVRRPGPAASRPAIAGHRVVLAGGGGRAGVAVSGPAPWSAGGGGARCRFDASSAASLVAMTGADAPAPGFAGAVDDTVRRWRERTGGVDDAPLRRDAVRALGEARCRRLLDVSAAVLLGLTSHAGGIVAAPTTSLPQWPGSARCWDYRYCWLRDASIAAQALLRLGLVDAARSIGEFAGDVIAEHGVRPLVRVDGSPAPRERLLRGLSGYRGATPVRVGNAAAQQLQIDVAGEVLELAQLLALAGALPASLGRAVPRLARWISEHWHEPDHGIWEIRGKLHPYTHSAVLAWVGLDRAVALAEAASPDADAPAWRTTADAIRAHVLERPGQPLQLHHGHGGADAALSVIAENGFLPPGDPVCAATLDLIAGRLERGGLLDRYEGRRDLLPDPCAPFVFPTLWMSTAASAAGRDGSGWLRAAAASCSPLGLFGEVVDPDSGGPLGNYPQVQSHAALVCALTPAAAG